MWEKRGAWKPGILEDQEGCNEGASRDDQTIEKGTLCASYLCGRLDASRTSRMSLRSQPALPGTDVRL